MKLGIFLCSCDNTLNIDFRAIKKAYKKDVDGFIIHDQLCQKGLEHISGDVKRWKLDSVMIGCTAKNHIFEEVFRGDIMFLDLKEQCGLVHEKNEATEKAKVLISRAINNLNIDLEEKEPSVIEVGNEVLVVGGSDAVEVANDLSEYARVALLITETDGYLPLAHSSVRVDLGHITGISGNIGDFRVEIESDIDTKTCISCEKCIEVCPLDSIKCNPFYYIDTSCDRCGKCIKVCPTDAISFDMRKVIRTDQILAIGKNWDKTTQFGVHIAREDSDLPSKVLGITSNVGALKKRKLLNLRNVELCSGGTVFSSSCDLCLTCPHDAISLKENKVFFNNIACIGCGFCSSICPISIPELTEYPTDQFYQQINDILDADLDSKIIIFTTGEYGLPIFDYLGKKRIKYPPVLSISVPSLSFISDAHILKAFELGVDGVILFGGAEELIAETVPFVENLLSQFGLGNRVLTLETRDPMVFVESVKDFSKNLEPSPIRRDMIRNRRSPDLEITKLGKRGIIVDTLRSLSLKTGLFPDVIKVNHENIPFRDIFINESCTICNSCSELCKTDALKKDEEKLIFTHAYCIACGICESTCPEKAIVLVPEIDFKRLTHIDAKLMIKSEMVECKKCGKPFITRSALEKISGVVSGGDVHEFGVKDHLDLINYCDKCRPVIALKKIQERK